MVLNWLLLNINPFYDKEKPGGKFLNPRWKTQTYGFVEDKMKNEE